MEWLLTQRAHTGTGKNTFIQLMQTEKHDVNKATAGYVVTVQKTMPRGVQYSHVVRYETSQLYQARQTWMPKQIGVICLSKQLVLQLSI